jgi:aldose 1-epimerase
MEHTLRPRAGYPFTLALRIDYALSDAGLRVTTTATNTGAEACPFGAGAHPYVTAGTPTVDTATLRVPAATVLRCDDRGLPVGAMAVADTDHDFRRPRPIGTTHLDHAFTDLDRGADGLARVELAGAPGDGVTLWLGAAYGYVMVFTGDPLPDVARHSIAIEPMTCPPNAFCTGAALVRIEPGASFRGVWGIAPGTGHG